MNIPTKTIDVWSPATETEKKATLAAFKNLPSRETSSAECDQATYFIAMEGATRWGLAQVVKAVHQNALGHPFFPAPSEIRKLHDAAMEPHVSMRDRIARQERIRQEAPPGVPPRTEEEKARAAAIMERFHASMPKSEAGAGFDWSRVHQRFDRQPPQPSTQVEQEDAA